MSRPKVAPTDDFNVKIEIPPGWSVNLNAVTRKSYNQLFTCERDLAGSSSRQKDSFKNSWQAPNETMINIATDADQLLFSPERDSASLNLQFYWSTQSSTFGEALQNEKYKSAGVNVLTFSKPAVAPINFPDYMTFIVSILTAIQLFPMSNPRYDDLVVNINCIERGIPPAPVYNLKNIQGDILPALPKALEYFYYFEISNVPKFRETFGKFILPKITTSEEVVNRPPPPPPNPEVKFLGVNVGFSYLGLQLFSLNDSLLDDSFEKGQQQDAKSLGDAGTQRGEFWTPNWDPEYKVDIHGIFLITAYNDNVASKFVDDMEAAFALPNRRSSIKKVVLLKGAPRPGADARNDHFGYRGGFGNPQVKGVTYKTEMKYPGAAVIPIGVIVMGYDGDEDKDRRPVWAKDGSFMVTRKLGNLVPEFDEFLLEHGPKSFPDLPLQKAADKLGARLFGRWKNGTPVERSPDHDDPSIANNDKEVNNFIYDQKAGQSRCPFAAHIRKSNPRNDVTPVESAFKHHIRRHNMPYGPEVSLEERDGNGSIDQRGLHLVCYQSSIVRGFKFIQQGWYNDPDFPPGKPTQPGWDPIFGQTGKEKENVHRFMSGTNPKADSQIMSFPTKFVDPRGGEYFFSPSISTLRDLIATT
ncbi:Dyp-type peroxidase [Tricholoma matsutake]|nr:Dyp-type peroxidase [Tricholoma matsutake 945]